MPPTQRKTRLDPLSPGERSDRMARIRNRDTKPEMVVRRLVHRLGYRYRLHIRDLPGCPDLVFRSRKKIIFVHGCFWHMHPGCPNNRPPKSNVHFWKPKLQSNRQRDLQNQAKLRELGWDLLIVWECQLRDRQKLADRIKTFLEDES